MAETALQAIVRSLGQDMKTISNVGNNVANMHTPGYRRTQSIPSFAEQASLGVTVDQRDGSLAQTGRPLDLALRGIGFFVVEHEGAQLLTRHGAFHVDGDGLLANANGDHVLGASGPISIPSGTVRVDSKGEVWVNSQQVGELRVISVKYTSQLSFKGAGLYAYSGEEGEWSGSIVQGALEQSNVAPADEMVKLMETTRHVESVQRVISIYDKAMDTGINRLGDN